MTATDTTTVKMPEEGAGAGEGYSLDGVLGELGSFGKYQLLLLLLLAFRDSFLNMCNFNYVFTAADVAHRCVVPECEAMDSRFNASWRSFALPNDTSSCHRMESDHTVLGNHSLSNPLLSNHSFSNQFLSNQSCSPQRFHLERTRPCERIVYEDYNSIVAEFNLGCEPWKRTFIGTVHNFGLVFSFILSGLISDRYGRKVIIVGTPLVVGTVGLVKSFSVNYWMLLVLEFLETALGYGNASMILSLETVSQKRRVIFSCIWDIMASFGTAFFGIIAWQIPYWRHLTRAIYAPLLVTVFYIFLVDEGVRWLLAHNKRDEAVHVLNKVAKYNNITLSSKAKEMLTKLSEQREKIDHQEGQAQQPRRDTQHLLNALRSRKIILRVVLVAALFFCSLFVYNGTVVNSGNVFGNKYANFAALYLVLVPTRAISALTLTRFSRKACICVSYLLCSVFFIISAFIPHSVSWSSLVFYLAGKMASSYGLFSVSLVAMEVFPTTSRNSLTNFANMFGRLGSVLAPQTPLLEEYFSGLPSIVFGVVALGPALLALLLPDTSRTALPDDVADAERIDTPATPAAPATPATPATPDSSEKESESAATANHVERF